jgi:hypothetical protein
MGWVGLRHGDGGVSHDAFSSGGRPQARGINRNLQGPAPLAADARSSAALNQQRSATELRSPVPRADVPYCSSISLFTTVTYRALSIDPRSSAILVFSLLFTMNLRSAAFISACISRIFGFYSIVCSFEDYQK